MILTLYPGGVLGFRVKQHKREWTLPVASAYRLAVQRERDLERAEKRKTRKVLARRGTYYEKRKQAKTIIKKWADFFGVTA